jgi:hypothetical protein
MKKINFIIYSLFLLSNVVLACENFLPNIIEKDQELIPHIKSIILSSELPKKEELFSSLESPELYKQLDFSALLKGIFGEEVWIPRVIIFSSLKLQEALQPYAPKLLASEVELIFLANVLYKAGSMLYEQTKIHAYVDHAASLGHPDAQLKMFTVNFRLGNLEEAKKNLFASAAQNHVRAMDKLSSVCLGGWGFGFSDIDLARSLCEAASELGSPEAQFRINAKRLADNGNQRALDFIDALMNMSGDAIQEGNEAVTNEDLNFLRAFLGWRDESEFDEP